MTADVVELREKPVRNAMEIWKRMMNERRFVCFGVDPQKVKDFPAEVIVRRSNGKIDVERSLYKFACDQVRAVAHIIGAVKPNAAFWLKYGPAGMRALKRFIQWVKRTFPELLLICDAKANDLGLTAEQWAYMYFVELGFDAVTVNPYMGEDCVKAFAAYEDKMVIVLIRTSNPSAKKTQDVICVPDKETFLQVVNGPAYHGRKRGLKYWPRRMPYYQWMALQLANEWNIHGNCAAVIGATVPEQMAELVKLLPDVPKLAPGFQKQGASTEVIIPASVESDGSLSVVANSSRGIMYAYLEDKYAGLSYTEAALAAATELHEDINKWYDYALQQAA
jgi:orotidine-5'-phosphate decarboxylase